MPDSDLSRPSPVAALLRVSTDEQDVGVQRRQVMEWMAREGYEGEPRWFTEEGVSGSAARRPELDRLLKTVGRGGVKVVVVAALDRLARSTVRLLGTLEAIQSAGADLVSLRERLDFRGAQGRMLAGMLAVFAEFEREIIRERTRAGLASARARGVVLGRRPDRWDDEADAALRDALARGVSPRRIAREGLVTVWKPCKDDVSGEWTEKPVPARKTAVYARVSELGLATST